MSSQPIPCTTTDHIVGDWVQFVATDQPVRVSTQTDTEVGVHVPDRLLPIAVPLDEVAIAPKGTIRRAFAGQDVSNPRLGFAKSPTHVVPHVAGRPNPKKNYAGGRIAHKPGSTRRYIEGRHADNSGFSETHNLVADPNAKYLLAEEKEPESLQRPERPGSLQLRRFDGPSGFHGGTCEHRASTGVTAEELARLWAVSLRNEQSKRVVSWDPAERRQREQRLSKAQRLVLRVLRLRCNKHLPWDAIADRLKLKRAVLREKIKPQLEKVLGPDALRLPSSVVRIDGRFVGCAKKQE